jgi:hypothetical protein
MPSRSDLPSSRVTVPALPLTGGCQCGAVRYVISARPVTFYLCHCTECQRHTSSAFGESLRIARGALAVEGEPSLTTRASEKGTAREGWFCPSCGVRIWHGSPGSGHVNIKAGTLDDTSWLVPAGHIWTRSAQPFMHNQMDGLTYGGQPDDGYAALTEIWAAMCSGGAEKEV